MKNLYFAFCLVSFSLSAQHYSLFPNPQDTLAFADSDGIISHIMFDSTYFSGNRSEYYPMGEMAINTKDTCYGRIFYDGWLGKKITDSAGHSRFTHQNFQLYFRASETSGVPKASGWLEVGNAAYTLNMRYDSTSFGPTASGTPDSIRYFSLLTADSTGTPLTSAPLTIAIARNEGLQRFPYLPGQRDYLTSHSTLKRTTHWSMKNKDIYNYSPGDEFHYLDSEVGMSPTTPLRSWRRIKKLVIDVRRDSLQNSDHFTFRETWTGYSSMSPPPLDTTYGVDTTYMTVLNLGGREPHNLSFQGVGILSSATREWSPLQIYWDEKILGNLRGYYQNTFLYRGDSGTTCFAPDFEPQDLKIWKAEGIGIVKETANLYASQRLRTYELVYYKKGSDTWGTPFTDVHLNEVHKIPLKIYPNPVSSILTIEIPEEARQLELSILDQAGKTIRHLTLSPGKTELELNDLPSGLYFLKSSKGVAKFIKM